MTSSRRLQTPHFDMFTGAFGVGFRDFLAQHNLKIRAWKALAATPFDLNR